MKNLTIETIKNWVGGQTVGEAVVTGVNVDSRMVQPGDLFVCLPGAVVDGHDYVAAAIQNGAVAVLAQQELSEDIPKIYVDDTMEALRSFAKAYRASLHATFIGITGSNGKTSTKDILMSILSLVGPTVATYKNQNTEIGTFLNLFRMNEETQFAVLEFGLDYPGDVAVMASLIRPDYGIITSLAPAHAEHFAKVSDIATEKVRIFDYIEDKNHCFYQGDFAGYRELDQGWKTFGFNANNDYHVVHEGSDNQGVSFAVNDVSYHCNLLGRHQGSNAAAAIAVVQAIGISEEVIQTGLNQVALTALRTEIVKKDKALILLDAYKSNPTSAQFALEILRDYEFDAPRIAVLSEMVELGEDSLKLHQEMIAFMETMSLEKVYLLGDEYQRALETQPHSHNSYTVFQTFDELNEAVQKLYQEKYMILIKGSRSYALERLMKG